MACGFESCVISCLFRHCEERSDAAIRFFPQGDYGSPHQLSGLVRDDVVICALQHARRIGSRQKLIRHEPKEALIVCSLSSIRHCEERSDAAIRTLYFRRREMRIARPRWGLAMTYGRYFAARPFWVVTLSARRSA